MHVGVVSPCIVCASLVCSTWGGQSGFHIPRDWVYREFWATTQVLVIEPGAASRKTSNVLNHWPSLQLPGGLFSLSLTQTAPVKYLDFTCSCKDPGSWRWSHLLASDRNRGSGLWGYNTQCLLSPPFLVIDVLFRETTSPAKYYIEHFICLSLRTLRLASEVVTHQNKISMTPWPGWFLEEYVGMV